MKKTYKISLKKRIILDILYIIISILISYNIQLYYKTIEVLFILYIFNMYSITFFILFIDNLKLKY